MTKTPIAVALLLAASATPSLADPFSTREARYGRPVEQTVERTVVRTYLTPAHRPAGHRHWRQSDWRRAHWQHNPWRQQHWQRSQWRRNDWRQQQWNRHDVHQHQGTRVSHPDTNSCIEGSVIGGLLGAGLGAALSRGDGRWIGVPGGGAAGALIGCQGEGG